MALSRGVVAVKVTLTMMSQCGIHQKFLGSESASEGCIGGIHHLIGQR